MNYNGSDYELGEEAYAELLEQQAAAAPEDTEGLGFQESCEQAIEAQGGDAAACDFDVTAWFSELENEGTEDVGGAETTHVAGTLDVEQMVTDLFQLGASIPGATGGVDPSLIEPQLAVVSEAVSGADFDVYAATDDGTLRGLDFSLDLDTAALGAAAAGVESRSLGSRSSSRTSARSRRSRRPPTRSRSRTSRASSAAGPGARRRRGSGDRWRPAERQRRPRCISDAAGRPGRDPGVPRVAGRFRSMDWPEAPVPPGPRSFQPDRLTAS